MVGPRVRDHPDAFLLMRHLIEGSRWANALVRQFSSSNYTAILMEDGRVLEFTARTTSQGRGKSAPKAIWDEGWSCAPSTSAPSTR